MRRNRYSASAGSSAFLSLCSKRKFSPSQFLPARQINLQQSTKDRCPKELAIMPFPAAVLVEPAAVAYETQIAQYYQASDFRKRSYEKALRVRPAIRYSRFPDQHRPATKNNAKLLDYRARRRVTL